jgi:hypothetical protein
MMSSKLMSEWLVGLSSLMKEGLLGWRFNCKFLVFDDPDCLV